MNICIKVVCNQHRVYNFTFREREIVYVFNMLFIVDWRKKMYNKWGHVWKEITNVIENNKGVL